MLLKRLLYAAVGIGMLGLVAGCDDDDGANAGGVTPLKQFAADDIASQSSDTAEPIEINDREFDMSNEDPAHYDDILQSE